MKKRRTNLRCLTYSFCVPLAILLTGCVADPGAHVQLDNETLTQSQVESARTDLGPIYNTDCYASYESSELAECVVHDSEAGPNVVLVGDSHAAQWLPALEEIAERQNWQLSFFGKRACSFSTNQHSDNKGHAYPSCVEWNENVQSELIREHPDLVITSNYARTKVMEGDAILSGSDGEKELSEGMVRAWSNLLAHGIDVTVIRDTPYLGYSTPDCLSENLSSLNVCRADFGSAVEEQPQPDLRAVEQLPAVRLIDLTKEFCTEDQYCESVRSGMIVWRDKHHMTETYARSLDQELGKKLSRSLD